MSDTVKIDGVLLTREQIERAHRELNSSFVDSPEAVEALHLKQVQMRGSKHRTGVVLSRGEVQANYLKGFNIKERAYPLQGILTVVSSNGSGYTYSTLKAFYNTWEVVK